MTDGINASKLAELETLKSMGQGTNSLTHSYNGLVAMVGAKTFQAQASHDASKSLLGQIKQLKEDQ